MTDFELFHLREYDTSFRLSTWEHLTNIHIFFSMLQNMYSILLAIFDTETVHADAVVLGYCNMLALK